MKKRLLAFILVISILATAMSISFIALADDIEYSFDSSTNTLTISGNGDMDNYADGYSTPWSSYLLHIEKIIVEDGITSIGNNAFAGATNLKEVELSDSVTKLGTNCLSSCSSLNELKLSSNVTSIADTSFAYNGVNKKYSFVLDANAGSYALYYAVKNSIAFNCESITAGTREVFINSKGMVAYYPYTPKYSTSFTVKSLGTHDTIGYLYDSNMKKLKENDDFGTTSNFGYTYNLEAGKTYYIGAKIYNSALTGKFTISIEASDFTFNGTVVAMASPNGDASNIAVANALVNGDATNNGSFSKYVVGNSELVIIEIDGKEIEYNVTVDTDNDALIPIMMCDVNDDYYVNAKDYSIMTKDNSPYLELYPNFINYNY